MTTLLCINPLSRSGDAVDIETLVARLHSLGQVVIHDLNGDEDLDEAIEALGDRLERIVVGGGDGTLHRVLPSVLGAGVPMGVLPLGTGNDFARSLGLPSDPAEAVESIVDGATRRVCLGKANGRWFLNAAGIGLGPELTRRLDHDRKRRLGVLAYLVSLIEVMGNRRRRRALLEIDDWEIRTPFMQITIANGTHYGGGLTIRPDAGLEEERLDVLVLKPQTPLELLSKFFALRWGARRGERHDKMELFSGTRVRVTTHFECDVTVDGELVEATPLDCEVVPDAMEVYVPLAEAEAETETETSDQETPVAATA